MDYHSLNVKELTTLIQKLKLEYPSKGSGKNNRVIKYDLITTLKYNKDIEFDKLSIDTLMEIAYNLPGAKVLEYCILNKRFAKMCSKEYFWIKKYQLDFNDYEEVKSVSMNKIYKFRIQQDPELRRFLIDYSNFDELNYYFQVDRYIEALDLFKALGNNNFIKEFENKKIKYQDTFQLAIVDLVTDIADPWIILQEYQYHEMINDDSLMIRVLNIYNSIMNTKYYFF